MDKILAGILSIGGIVFTYWFFLMKREEEAVVVGGGNVEITVEGGYSPNVISIPKGKPTTLTFFRKDPSTCLEEVVLNDFKIRKYLPFNAKTSITITPNKVGEFVYSCGMSMFHGKIIVTQHGKSEKNISG